MQKRLTRFISAILLLALVILSGCGSSKKTVKLGASFGVGGAERWVRESEYMKNKAGELGAEIEVRLNKTDTPKTQEQDCIEMIDSGIDVLILVPRDATKVDGILSYAKTKNVPVISYARVVLGKQVDLFVGYDSNRIGQLLGKYLAEMVYKGDYIILRGDAGDNNASLLYSGAMRYIDPIKDNINVLTDSAVPGWSRDEAKKIVKDAVAKNSNSVDAILAPNDVLAGAADEALTELGVTSKVIITGMDAELDAVRRIVEGKQSVTVYMDLKELAETAVTEACHLAKNEPVTTNAEFDNQSGETIEANLITGQLITRENIDKMLIEPGYFTKEQVYG